MADKSAFVPVDAIGNHKNTDLDVDIDDELFGKKPPAPSAAAPAAPAAPATTPPPSVAKPVSPAPPPAPAPARGYTYKKPVAYQKTYAK
ncbi:unnamed protein product [Caenorhabditis auriculariae]|uniref:Uncharacterized protein n=1 Tax=Caenorhabditis auriculariae TaxID=2777116 RepID=A0A8S1H3T6_9PELO|nr:unnamed protein product [Caenorhabditis auriculariae]